MKIKDGFVKRKLGDKYICVSVNDDDKSGNIIITLNNSAEFVWNILQNDTSYDDILAALLDHYDVEREVVKSDLDICLNKIREVGILEE